MRKSKNEIYNKYYRLRQTYFVIFRSGKICKTVKTDNRLLKQLQQEVDNHKLGIYYSRTETEFD